MLVCIRRPSPGLHAPDFQLGFTLTLPVPVPALGFLDFKPKRCIYAVI